MSGPLFEIINHSLAIGDRLRQWSVRQDVRPLHLMTKLRRPILIVVNLLLLLLGGGFLTTSIAIWQSSNLVLRYHAPKEEVTAKVYQISDVSKLQAMAVNQYEYLDTFATMIEGFRDMTLVAAVLLFVFGTLNFTLIPWRLRKREEKA